MTFFFTLYYFLIKNFIYLRHDKEEVYKNFKYFEKY